MKTYSNNEERMKAVLAVEAGDTIASVARQFQISAEALKINVRQFRAHGEIHSYAYGWTVEQKYQVLKYKQEKQLSAKETGIRFQVSVATICKWEKEYLEKGIEGLENHKKGRKSKTPMPKPPKTREEELLDRIQYLQAENDYLKKLNALVAERVKREKGKR
jgi:transposase